MSHYQATFDGRRIPLGSQQDRIQSIMESDEGCRNYLMEMLWVLWMDDGLQYLLTPEQHITVQDWFVKKATNAKSAINRWQDLQRLFTHLAPSPDVAEKRGRVQG